MKSVSLQFALLAAAGVLALGAVFSTFAHEDPGASSAVAIAHYQDGEDDEGEVTTISAQEGDEGTDVLTVAIWTISGILVGGLILAVFFMLKRRVGGFPKNPAWVAPITIMPSREFADEGDFGDQTPSHQAHAEH